MDVQITVVKNEIGIMYNDKDIGIDWPVKNQYYLQKIKVI